MSRKLRHFIGISGGKDSAALAIYLSNKYPEINFEYYFCDTGEELKETYDLINGLESIIGKKIVRLRATKDKVKSPFESVLKDYKGYLPSVNARWCTKKLKLEPFEKYVNNDPVISYVAIRGDENREGYVSLKPNIQSIYPFRRNIWSIEVISEVLNYSNITAITELYKSVTNGTKRELILEIVNEPKSTKMSISKKLNLLLDIDITAFNEVVLKHLQRTNYPLALESFYPLVNNEDIITLEDIFTIFKNNGITPPKYYDKIEFELNGKKGHYSRSRSGCYFCFFQQKIEWIWLYEQHKELFKKAMLYEKDGYSWNEDETLEEMIRPERIIEIKEEHIKRTEALKKNYKSSKLIEILMDEKGPDCVNCLI